MIMNLIKVNCIFKDIKRLKNIVQKRWIKELKTNEIKQKRMIGNRSSEGRQSQYAERL